MASEEPRIDASNVFNAMFKPSVTAFAKNFLASKLSWEDMDQQQIEDMYYKAFTECFSNGMNNKRDSNELGVSNETKVIKKIKVSTETLATSSSNASSSEVTFPKHTQCMWNRLKQCETTVAKIRVIDGKVYCGRHNRLMLQNLGMIPKRKRANNEAESDDEEADAFSQQPSPPVVATAVAEAIQATPATIINQPINHTASPTTVASKKVVKKVPVAPTQAPVVTSAVAQAPVVAPVTAFVSSDHFAFENEASVDYKSSKNSVFWKLVPYNNEQCTFLDCYLNPTTNLVLQIQQGGIMPLPYLVGMDVNKQFIHVDQLDYSIITWAQLSNVRRLIQPQPLSQQALNEPQLLATPPNSSPNTVPAVLYSPFSNAAIPFGTVPAFGLDQQHHLDGSSHTHNDSGLMDDGEEMVPLQLMHESSDDDDSE